MELSITNYIVISTTNYADGESDNDEEKKRVKNVCIHVNFPVSKHDRFPKLEGNRRKTRAFWVAVKNPPSPLFP